MFTANMESWGRLLLVVGSIIIITGLMIILAERMGIGRLPGDILIRRENLTIFFPITTMIIISIILTLIFNLIRRL